MGLGSLARVLTSGVRGALEGREQGEDDTRARTRELIAQRAAKAKEERATYEFETQKQDRASQQANAVTAEERRAAKLRARAKLMKKDQRFEGYSDDDLIQLAEDDDVWKGSVSPKASKWSDAKEADGAFFQVNEEGETRTLKGVRPKRSASSSGGGASGPLVQVEDEEGNIIYVPRSEAVGRRAPRKSGAVTEGERKAGSQVGAAEAAAANIDAAGTRPGFIERQISKIPVVGNTASREKLQTLDQATRELAIAYLRVTSGATVTLGEIELTMKTVMPQAGDRPQTLKQKREARQRMVDAVKGAAGRAVKESPEAPGQKKANAAAILSKYGIK